MYSMLINKKTLYLGVGASIVFGCKETVPQNLDQQSGISDILINGLLLLISFLILGVFVIKIISIRKKRSKRPTNNDNENHNFSSIQNSYADHNAEIVLLNKNLRNLQQELNASKQKYKALEDESLELRKELEATKLQDLQVDSNIITSPLPTVEKVIKDNVIKLKYSKFADEKGVFPHTHLTTSDDGSCYYQLTIDEEKRTGQFEPIISELNMHSFKNNKSMLLFPYCEIVNVLDFWSNINILEPGSLKPSDVEWIVENKCRIELV
ncbi:hypothetical protein FIC_01089 [Flavobacteriaceae bacterium 3519-10]|nr:hypothetical protein FIC_01089 [Flavobacteriaceae bacterium 3519-10]